MLRRRNFIGTIIGAICAPFAGWFGRNTEASGTAALRSLGEEWQADQVKQPDGTYHNGFDAGRVSSHCHQLADGVAHAIYSRILASSLPYVRSVVESHCGYAYLLRVLDQSGPAHVLIRLSLEQGQSS